MIRRSKKVIRICAAGLLFYIGVHLLLTYHQQHSIRLFAMMNDNAAISSSKNDVIHTGNHTIHKLIVHKNKVNASLIKLQNSPNKRIDKINISSLQPINTAKIQDTPQKLTVKEKKGPPNFKTMQSYIITPHTFAFLINHPNRCTEKNISIIFYIHTAPNNIDRRNRIRNTWSQIHSHNGFNISHVFLLGNSMNVTVENMLKQEDSKYGDLIQEDFTDSYRNLSTKHIMGMKWVSTFCKTAKFIVKLDDDVIVDPFHLTRYLRDRFHGRTPKKIMYCSIYGTQRPHRPKNVAWHVPPEEYPEDKYPPYCEGFAYIISPDVAFQLFNVSQYLPLFWIDDIHVTGIVRRQTDINLEQWKRPNNYALMQKLFISERAKDAIFFLARWDDILVNWDGIWNKILQYKM